MGPWGRKPVWPPTPLVSAALDELGVDGAFMVSEWCSESLKMCSVDNMGLVQRRR